MASALTGCGRNEPPLGAGQPLYGEAPFTAPSSKPPVDLGVLKDLKSYRPAKFEPLSVVTITGPEDEIRETLKGGLLALQKFDVAGILELFDPEQIGPLADDPTTLEDLADRLDRLNRLAADKLGLPDTKLTAEQLDALLSKLDIEVSGDEATVRLPQDLMQQMAQGLAGPMGGPMAGAAPPGGAAPPAAPSKPEPRRPAAAGSPRVPRRAAPEPNKPQTPPVSPPPAAPGGPAGGALAGLLTYEKDIRPIFEAHCFKCHDAENAFGGLVLDSYASLMSTGQDAPVIVPGKPDESRLWKLVSHAEEPHMPKKANKLDDATLAKIRAWIQTGALEKLPAGAGGGFPGLGGLPLGGAAKVSFQAVHMARRDGEWRIVLPWTLTERGAEFVNAACGIANDLLDQVLEQMESAEKLDLMAFQQIIMQAVMSRTGDFVTLARDYGDVIESLQQPAPATQP